MFSYITLGTNDLPRATVFYDAVMAALGISRVQMPGEDDWHGWGWQSGLGRQWRDGGLCCPRLGVCTRLSCCCASQRRFQ